MQSGVAERQAIITNNLSRLRGKRSQQQIADAIGVTRQTIYGIESGEVMPRQDTLAALIRFYGCPVVFDVPTDSE